MSNAKEMSFKAKMNNLAKAYGLRPQTIIMNFMFERFLDRLSRSQWRDSFVIKGGVLISSMVGLKARATMDIDTTAIMMKMSIPSMRKAIGTIAGIDADDGVSFRMVSAERIRVNTDGYGGIRIKLEAALYNLRVPLSIDITGGDSIAPPPVEYGYKCMFADNMTLNLRAYSVETVLAEKCETILQRNVVGTRARDYYDVYVLFQAISFDISQFSNALQSTCKLRETASLLSKWAEILDQIAQSRIQKTYWKRYQMEFPYATGIDFADVIDSVRRLLGTVLK